jgi:hypothetical protein
MSYPVYSTGFFRAASVSGGPSTEYVVPAGYVAVVKCISIVWGDLLISGLDAWVQTQDLAKLVRYTYQTPPAAPDNIGGCFVQEGVWTLNNGDELQVQTALGTCDFTASGYLLTLP